MPVAVEPHPSRETLDAYGVSSLDEARTQEVEQHLTACAACLLHIDHLPSDPFVTALRAAYDDNGTGYVVTVCGEVAPSVADGREGDADALAVPAELANYPRYRVADVIGRGGMGTVYRAEHLLMERPVALKVISPRLLEHDGSLARFRQEVKAAAKLHHPNIVTAFDAEQVGSLTVLVMEYVAGRSLADHLKDVGPLPVAEACEYIRQAALGLQHAHDRGMVHRDVKPHNLMLEPVGRAFQPAGQTADRNVRPTFRVKILDFGLARFVCEGLPDPVEETSAGSATPPEDGGLTSTGACMGTLDYLAPEQARDARQADSRADVYGLGATLYHLLTGRVPFPGGSGLEKLARLSAEEPVAVNELRPDVPGDLAAILQRMMAKRPEDRFATAEEVAAALAPFAVPPRARPRRERRGPILVGLVSLLIASLLGAAVVAKFAPDRTEQSTEPELPEFTDNDPPPRITPVSVIPDNLKEFGVGAPIAFGLAVSPDGLLAVSCGGHEPDVSRQGRQFLRTQTDSLLLWDLAKGEEVGQFTEGAGASNSVCFSPDGSRIAAAIESDCTVRIWDVKTRKLIHTLKGHTQEAVGVAWSPDGRRLVSAGWDTTLRLWDARTGKELGIFGGGKTAWGRVVFTPDGKSVIAAGLHTIARFDLQTLQQSWQSGPTTALGRLIGLAVSPDGKQVLTGSREAQVPQTRLWNADNGEPLPPTLLHEDWVSGVAFTPDGKSIVSAGWNHAVRIAPTDGSSQGEIVRLPSQAMSLALTPDGKHALVGCLDHTIRVVPLAPAPALPPAPPSTPPVFPLASSDTRFPLFHPDGKRLLLPDGPNVAVWDVGGGKKEKTFSGSQGRIMVVRLTADAKTVVGLTQSKQIVGWEWDSGRQVAEFAGPESSEAVTMAVFPDGKRVVVPGKPGFVSIRDWPSGKESASIDLRVPRTFVYALDVSSDGRWLAAVGGNGRAWVWDVREGKMAGTLPGLPPGIHEYSVCAFSADGRYLAIGSNSGVRVLQSDSWTAPPRLILADGGGLVGFDPTGGVLTTAGIKPNGSSSVALMRWDWKTGRALSRLPLSLAQEWNHCALAPDGKTVAVHVDSRRAFVLFDPTTAFAELPPTLTGGLSEVRRHPIPPPQGAPGQPPHVNVTAFSPDGTAYAAAGEDGIVRVWDLASGKPRQAFDHGGELSGLTFTPDGKRLVSAGRVTGVRVWDLVTGAEQRRFTVPPSSWSAFSPDARLAFFGGDGGNARVFDVEAGRQLWHVKFIGPVVAAFSPDGKRFTVRLGTTTLQTFDVRTWEHLSTATGPEDWALDHRYVAGKVLVVGSERLTWLDPDTLKEVRRLAFRLPGKLPNWGASPDGRRLVIADRGEMGARLWDLDTGSEIGRVPLPTRPSGYCNFSPDGRYVVSGGFRGYAFLFRVEAPLPRLAPTLTMTGHDKARSVAVSPDGKWAYSAGYDNLVRVWDLAAGKEVRRIADGTEPFDALALSPDGSKLLVTHRDLTARLWDAETGKALQTLKGHTKAVACVAFSPDGKQAITGGHDNAVWVWDLATGKVVKHLAGHTGPVRVVAFLPGGRRAITGAEDRTALVWDLATGKPVKTLGPFSFMVLSVAPCPDGKHAVLSAGPKRAPLLVALETGNEVRWFRGHTDEIHTVALSPDGKLLVSAGFDRTARVWDFETGECLGVCVGHTGVVISAAFRDNRGVVTASDDGTVRLWHLPAPPAR